MLGLMQNQPLLISSLIEFASRHHATGEIVSRRVEGDIHRSTWRNVAERARKVYDGMTPLSAADVAEAIAWVATRPSHVDIDELVIRPRDQASALLVHRRTKS